MSEKEHLTNFIRLVIFFRYVQLVPHLLPVALTDQVEERTRSGAPLLENQQREAGLVRVVCPETRGGSDPQPQREILHNRTLNEPSWIEVSFMIMLSSAQEGKPE